MAQFNLTFNMDNDAFEGNRIGEMSRILLEVERDVRRGNKSGGIYDINGNKVGKWSITEDKE